MFISIHVYRSLMLNQSTLLWNQFTIDCTFHERGRAEQNHDFF